MTTTRDITALVATAAKAWGHDIAAEVGARQLAVERKRAELAAKREAAAHNADARRGEHAPPVVGGKSRPPGRNAQARVMEELRERIANERGVSTSLVELPPWIDWRIRSECLQIARGGERAAVKFAAMIPGRFRSVLLGCVADAGGFGTLRGRRLVQCAWATWRLARRVKGKRGTPWLGGRVVDGYARAVWCLVCLEADGSVPGLNTLWGTHCGSLSRPGPMAELARAGAWTRIQPPADVARFVGPSGWAVGQMWFGRRNTGDAPRDGDVARWGAELAELLAALERPPPSH